MRTKLRARPLRVQPLVEPLCALVIVITIVLLCRPPTATAAATTETSPPAAAADEQYDVGDDPLFDGDGSDASIDRGELAEAESDPLFDDEFELEEEAPGIPDPFEKVNRGTLAVNGVVDEYVMDPITVGYRFIFPEPVRRSVERFFDNINSTQTLVNDIFQLEWLDACVTTGRLVVNSTVGLGGLFDPAEHMGMPSHGSDFGQTLALAGAPSGPYFVLPLLGPSNVRDGLGIGVDAIFHPTFFVLGGTDVLFFSGSSGLTERARHYDELKALEESSIDYYAALRSGYTQNRDAEIWERREHHRDDETVATASAAPAP